MEATKGLACLTEDYILETWTCWTEEEESSQDNLVGNLGWVSETLNRTEELSVSVKVLTDNEIPMYKKNSGFQPLGGIYDTKNY